MPDIRDARSAALLGQARAAEWADEFRAKWTKPDDEAKLLQWWNGIPPQIHEQLDQMDPENHRKLAKFIQSIEEKYRWHK